LWQQVQNKVPLYLYGSKYIEELDLSNIAVGLKKLVLNGCYDDDLKSSFLKKLNLGITLSDMESGIYNEQVFDIGANEELSSTGTALDISEADA
jgi:hypothetical protein